jgi:hypothetical protein
MDINLSENRIDSKAPGTISDFLENESIRTLLTQEKDRVEFFSHLLNKRRINYVQAFIPAFVAAISQEQWDFFWNEYLHFRINQYDAIPTPILDSVLFSKFILGDPEHKTSLGTEISEVLLYELRRNEISIAGKKFQELRSIQQSDQRLHQEGIYILDKCYIIEKFQSSISSRINKPNSPASIHNSYPEILLFFRGSTDRGVTIVKINPLVCSFINACDGSKSVQEVLDSLKLDPGCPERKSLEALATHWLKQGILKLIGTKKAIER